MTGFVTCRRLGVGIVLMAALLLAGCGSAPDAIVIPLDPAADPADVEAIQAMLVSDRRVVDCVYACTKVGETDEEAWLEVGFPAGQSWSDFDRVLAGVENHPAFDRAVRTPEGTWWGEP